MNICPDCGTAFKCGMTEDSSGPCWCTQLPPLPPQAYAPDKTDAATSRCFCPNCLRGLLAAQNLGSQCGG
jgi:hypothetical protein